MGGRGANSGVNQKSGAERELAIVNAKMKKIGEKVDKINAKAEKSHGAISEKEMQEGMQLSKQLTELSKQKKDLEKQVATEKATKAFAEHFAKNTTSSKTRASGWSYNGFRDRVRDLEKSLDGARSINKINAVAKGARSLIKTIDKELQNPEGNTVRLKAYKRQAEALIKKAEKSYSTKGIHYEN